MSYAAFHFQPSSIVELSYLLSSAFNVFFIIFLLTPNPGYP